MGSLPPVTPTANKLSHSVRYKFFLIHLLSRCTQYYDILQTFILVMSYRRNFCRTIYFEIQKYNIINLKHIRIRKEEGRVERYLWVGEGQTVGRGEEEGVSGLGKEAKKRMMTMMMFLSSSSVTVQMTKRGDGKLAILFRLVKTPTPIAAPPSPPLPWEAS